MRFLLDESAELRIQRVLHSLGHDVTAIVRDYQRSISDIDVLATAHRESRTLITNDRDFVSLVFNQHRPHSGVILFRLGRGSIIEDKISILQFVLANYQTDLDAFITIHADSIVVQRTPIIESR